MCSGPHAKSVCISDTVGPAVSAHVINNIPDHDGHVHVYIHRENRSLIQSLTLMHWAIISHRVMSLVNMKYRSPLMHNRHRSRRGNMTVCHMMKTGKGVPVPSIPLQRNK